jgi:electron transfer flavoprotein alpha subunit
VAAVIAVVPVRRGEIVTGGAEAIAEAGGVAIVVGDQAAVAADAMAARALAGGTQSQCRELQVLELGAFRPAAWAMAIAPHISERRVVILPASPDGRDVAPRLAAVLGWPLLAGAIRVTASGASLARMQGRQIANVVASGPFVVTLLPGSRSAAIADDELGAFTLGGPPQGNGRPDSVIPEPPRGRAVPTVIQLEAPEDAVVADAELIEVLEADPAVMDLAEATRIVSAGAGIGGPEHLARLQAVAAQLGASVGATRVVTDAGWLDHDRQIGTTGVSVRPRCYVAFGVSGAVQHIGGLGSPQHVISVNLDRSCPMMAMADLALVTDARDVVEVLARRLSEQTLARADDPAQADDAQADVAHADVAQADVTHADVTHADVAKADVAQADVAQADDGGAGASATESAGG